MKKYYYYTFNAYTNGEFVNNGFRYCNYHPLDAMEDTKKEIGCDVVIVTFFSRVSKKRFNEYLDKR